MMDRLNPDNPLGFIIECVRRRKIRWTYHVNMRMKGRFIPRELILNSVTSYEIIEEYPKDRYFPSYLVYYHFQNRIFHVLFAADLEGDNVRVITSYYPTQEEWEENLKVRRRSL